MLKDGLPTSSCYIIALKLLGTPHVASTQAKNLVSTAVHHKNITCNDAYYLNKFQTLHNNITSIMIDRPKFDLGQLWLKASL